MNDSNNKLGKQRPQDNLKNIFLNDQQINYKAKNKTKQSFQTTTTTKRCKDGLHAIPGKPPVTFVSHYCQLKLLYLIKADCMLLKMHLNLWFRTFMFPFWLSE